MRHILKLAKQYRKTLARYEGFTAKGQGLFDDSPLGFGLRNFEDNQEEQKSQDRQENQKVLDQVLAWYQQFGVIPDSDTQEDILSHNRKSSLSLKDATSFGDLGQGWYDLDVKVDMKTGEIMVNNLRAGFTGSNIPKDLKDRIEQASGKRLTYHKPTDSWVYDAELDGGLNPGDSKMLEIARKLLRS